MKNYVISAVISIIAVLVGLGLYHPSVTQPVGAVTGPDSYFPCESHNGITSCFAKVRMTQSTTTVCAIKSPTATSSLVRASASFTTGTTTNSLVTVAKAATAFATTTSLGQIAIAGNAAGSITVATSTPLNTSVALDGTGVFAPNTFLVFGMQDATAENTAGSFSPVGSCNGTFELLN